MSDFRTRLLGLAAVATAFAGLSYGQTFQCGYNGIVGTTGTGLGYAGPGFGANPGGSAASNGQGYAPTQVRISATNDLVTDLVFACAQPTPNVSSVGALTVTLSAPVASRTNDVPSEATLIITPTTGTSGTGATLPPFVASAASSTYSGTVSGNQVVFTGVTFPASAYVVEVANIRVNDTGLAATTPITESAFITNLGLVQFSAPAIPVGYVFADFSTPTVSSPGTFPICVGSSTSFTVTVTEKFGAAFKSAVPGGINSSGAPLGNTSVCGSQTCDMANGNTGSWNATTGFTSVGGQPYNNPGIGSGVGQATHGTRFALTFSNMNAGVSITLPTTITESHLTAYMTSSATGPFSFVTGPTYTVPLNGTVYYEIAYADDTFQTLPLSIGGTLSWSANFSTTPVSAPVVTVSEDPASAVNTTTNDIPNFVANPTPLTLSTWILCNTTLLFPYVSAGNGFDTGIVFANTSTDPLTTVGQGTATAEAGPCNMWFYGTGAPTNPIVAPYTAGGASNNTQPTAVDNAFLLSQVAPGFSGYMIAICNYQYAHGFAYITYDLTQTNGAAMGYLALIIPEQGAHRRPVNGAGSEYLGN